MEETGEPGENLRPVWSHWQTLSHNGLLFVCKWIGPGYKSINSGKNAFNPIIIADIHVVCLINSKEIKFIVSYYSKPFSADVSSIKIFCRIRRLTDILTKPLYTEFNFVRQK